MTSPRTLIRHLEAQRYDLVEESCLNLLASKADLPGCKKAEWIELLAQVYALKKRRGIAERLLVIAADLRKQSLPSAETPQHGMRWVEDKYRLRARRMKKPTFRNLAASLWDGLVLTLIDVSALLRRQIR